MTGSTSITPTEETRGRTPTRHGETSASKLSITTTYRPQTPPKPSILHLEPESVDDSKALTAEEEKQLRQQAQRRRELALSKSNSSK